jgi:peptidoglycan/LPS O-acetylase OafA/YrhL
VVVYLALGCSVLGLIGCAVAENFFSYIAPLCRLPEFLFGIVVGLMLADPPRAGSRAALALAGARALAALAAVNPACRSGLWTRANFFRAGLRALIFALARFEQRSATRSGNTGIARFFMDRGETFLRLLSRPMGAPDRVRFPRRQSLARPHS